MARENKLIAVDVDATLVNAYAGNLVWNAPLLSELQGQSIHIVSHAHAAQYNDNTVKARKSMTDDSALYARVITRRLVNAKLERNGISVISTSVGRSALEHDHMKRSKRKYNYYSKVFSRYDADIDKCFYALYLKSLHKSARNLYDQHKRTLVDKGVSEGFFTLIESQDLETLSQYSLFEFGQKINGDDLLKLDYLEFDFVPQTSEDYKAHARAVSNASQQSLVCIKADDMYTLDFDAFTDNDPDDRLLDKSKAYAVSALTASNVEKVTIIDDSRTVARQFSREYQKLHKSIPATIRHEMRMTEGVQLLTVLDEFLSLPTKRNGINNIVDQVHRLHRIVTVDAIEPYLQQLLSHPHLRKHFSNAAKCDPLIQLISACSQSGYSEDAAIQSFLTGLLSRPEVLSHPEVLSRPEAKVFEAINNMKNELGLLKQRIYPNYGNPESSNINAHTQYGITLNAVEQLSLQSDVTLVKLAQECCELMVDDVPVVKGKDYLSKISDLISDQGSVAKIRSALQVRHQLKIEASIFPSNWPKRNIMKERKSLQRNIKSLHTDGLSTAAKLIHTVKMCQDYLVLNDKRQDEYLGVGIFRGPFSKSQKSNAVEKFLGILMGKVDSLTDVELNALQQGLCKDIFDFAIKAGVIHSVDAQNNQIVLDESCKADHSSKSDYSLLMQNLLSEMGYQLSRSGASDKTFTIPQSESGLPLRIEVKSKDACVSYPISKHGLESLKARFSIDEQKQDHLHP